MKAALLTEINQPLVLANVEPCELLPGQVLVKVLVSGICGKQLGEIAGTQNEDAPRPRLLGHEGCGIVEKVHFGSKFKTGQKVVMHWRKGSGMESRPPEYVLNGKVITSGKITTFTEFSVCSENRLTAVPDETPNELCALLGCGLSTALGVMENEAKLKAGESVLIVGCGGVGLNLIRVAKMFGASSIHGVDSNSTYEKAKMAVEAGADGFDCVPWGQYDVVVDTTGTGTCIPQVNPSGRYILVGQPKEGAKIELYNARHLFDGEGKTIKATQGGQFNPEKDIPRYVKMWQSNHLKIDGIVTHRFPFSEINEAIATVQAGNAGRALLEMV